MRIRKNKTKSSDSGVVCRVGNFIVRKRGDGEHSFMCLTTADGGWRTEYRDDTMKYAWVAMLATDPRHHEILHAFVVLAYHVTSCNPDGEFLNDAISALRGLQERAAAYESPDEKQKRAEALSGLDTEMEMETFRESLDSPGESLENTEK